MLILTLATALAIAPMTGCSPHRAGRDRGLMHAPYPARQLWAVAPLRNESGSLQADGLAVADHLARQLENARPIDVVPVNRVLAAMESLGMSEVASPQDVVRLRQVLNVDGMIVGTLSAYDPYDPPKLGMAVELYVDPQRDHETALDLRQLVRAPTDEMSTPPVLRPDAPANVISHYADAADPRVRKQLMAYAEERGVDEDDEDAWRLYRMSMDLYTEFVSHQVARRLLEAERNRLLPSATADPAS